jgi:Holliday junction resolvase RusA-like endonuclease
MSTYINFFANGHPKGQPRPKAFSRGGRAGVYDPGTAEGWKGQVAIAAKDHRPAQPLTGPLSLILNFKMPRPKGHYRTGKRASELKDNTPFYHTGKPDVDNAAKAIMDAMTQLAFWQDDAQVASCLITKIYTQDTPPGCEIILQALRNPYLVPLLPP